MLRAGSSCARLLRHASVANRAVTTHIRTLNSAPTTKPFKDRDWDAVTVPFKAVGNDPNVNWSLCMHQVPPANNAHHHLDHKGLVMRSRGSLGKQRSLNVETTEVEEVKTFVHKDQTVQPELLEKVTFPNDPRVPTVPSIRYKKLFTAITDQLRHADDIFVHDWNPLPSVHIRLITDDAPTALLFRNVTGATEAPPMDVFEFAADASVVYHSSTFDLASSGIKLGANEFSVFDPMFNTMLVGGTHNKHAVVDAASALVANTIALDSAYGKDNGVVVTCDSVKGKGSMIGVFGANPSEIPASRVGSHAHVLSDTGLAPIFPGGVGFGDLSSLALTENVKGPKGATQRVTGCASGQAEPGKVGAVVLVVDDDTKVLPSLAKLNSAQAAHHFVFGANADATKPCFSSLPHTAFDYANQVKERLLKQNCQVYLVNRSAAGAAVPTIIQALADGEAGKFGIVKPLNMMVCSQLQGVAPKVFKYNTNGGAVKQFATKRTQSLTAFYGVVPEEVLAGGVSSS